MMQEEINDLIIKIHENTKDLPRKFEEHEKLDNKRFLWVLIALMVFAAYSGILMPIISIAKISL